jgi:hypothetical protein
MRAERRGRVARVRLAVNRCWCREEPGERTKVADKPFDISKWVVWEAFERVKANKGAAGVDEESIAQFEVNRDRNLYKIWSASSRAGGVAMSSG